MHSRRIVMLAWQVREPRGKATRTGSELLLSPFTLLWGSVLGPEPLKDHEWVPMRDEYRPAGACDTKTIFAQLLHGEQGWEAGRPMFYRYGRP